MKQPGRMAAALTLVSGVSADKTGRPGVSIM